jgi:hypothetical protein
MKKFLIILGLLCLLYIVLALVGPKRVFVEREILIAKPVKMIRTKLVDFKYFNENWNPWMDLDPAMIITYHGEAGVPGHSYQWDGNKKVREGKMLYESTQGDTVFMKVMFGKDGKMGKADAALVVSETEGGTIVKWTMHSEIGFIQRPFMLFVNMDKMVGELYENGLEKLKLAIESEKEAYAYNITEQIWNEKTFLAADRKMMAIETCDAYFGKNIPKMTTNLQTKNFQPHRGPAAFYFSWDERIR